jgi:hypothetical protein
MGRAARTANPLQTTGIFGGKRGFAEMVLTGKPLHDCSGNWDHLNLIFPVYLKLMTGFPFFQPEDVGAELLH